MKKLLLVAALLFSASAFAQGIVPQPRCIDGKLTYMNQSHFVYDFCVVHLKAVSPPHCDSILNQLSQDKVKAEYDSFIKIRTKIICGSK